MPIVDQVIWLDGFVDAAALLVRKNNANALIRMSGTAPEPDNTKTSLMDLGWENIAFSTGFGFRFPIAQFPFRFYFLKRFTFDGSSFEWKGDTGLEFVLSVSQPL
jgi:outer membrane protein assembly factor BamA